MTSLAALTATTHGLPCRETDPELWFSNSTLERADAARRCRACPLLLDCMRYALDADERHGVWGGVDFEARAMGCGTERGYQIHLRRKETACPLCQSAHDDAVQSNRRRLLAEAHRAGGTAAGYWMHRRLGEEACVRCKRAQARKSQERRDRDREAGDRARAAWGAPEGRRGAARRSYGRTQPRPRRITRRARRPRLRRPDRHHRRPPPRPLVPRLLETPVHELNCPACPGRRDPRHQLCPACWRALPAATRGRLALNDPYAHIRRHQLRAQLKDHTPLGVIRVSR